MPIETLVTFADLLALLKESRVPHEVDMAAQVVELPANAPPFVGHTLIRWEKKLPYVQIIAPMVRNIPPDRRADLEEAICRANNTISLPGFGYEYDRNFVYMRLCVPMYEEGMLVKSFRNQIASVVSNARQFLVPFQKVVTGEHGERILALAVAEAAANPS
jgi:hypothetical protein